MKEYTQYVQKEVFKAVLRAIGFALLGLAFLGGGLFFGWGLMGLALDANALRDAIVVPARVKDVHIVTRTSTSRNGTSTSSHVEAVYEFEFQGNSFQSSHLALWQEPSHFYSTLKAAEESGTTVPCYVAPSKPKISVLNMEFSLWPNALSLLFALLFSVIGILLVVGSVVDFLSHVVVKHH